MSNTTFIRLPAQGFFENALFQIVLGKAVGGPVFTPTGDTFDMSTDDAVRMAGSTLRHLIINAHIVPADGGQDEHVIREKAIGVVNQLINALTSAPAAAKA